MAEFYGTLRGGSANPVTKTGTKSSGITASVQSWNGSIITALSRGKDNALMVQVSYLPDSSGSTMGKLAYYGTFEDYIRVLKEAMELGSD